MVTIRLAKNSDFDFFWSLKSEDYNIFWAGAADKPDMDNLKRFFDSAVEKAGEPDTRKIYIIINENDEKVGHLYIIPDGEEHGLATAIMSRFCCQGYAKQAIKLGLDLGKKLGFKRMVDYVREDNIASQKAYSSCGVTITEEFKTVYIPKLNDNVKMYKMLYEY